MNFKRATGNDLSTIYKIVQSAIDEVYALYYPADVVQFFKNYHSLEHIKEALISENIFLLEVNKIIVGTGSLFKNELKRMFVLPEHQKKGYGKKILTYLETTARDNGYDKVHLDASLPAFEMYQKMGYTTHHYHQILTENQEVLCYYEMNKNIQPKDPLNYNNRIFTALSNSDNGEVSDQTLFHYHQEYEIIWAEYSGGDILKGFLVGTVSRAGQLNFTYQHVNNHFESKTGKCVSTPEVIDGKIILNEAWEWTSGDKSKGTSKLIEVIDEQ